jgi:predicted nucleic acid-binding protein
MTAPVFVDTNVLVYLKDTGDPAKRASATAWFEVLRGSRRGRTSFQVLQEFYATVTQRLRPGMPRAEAREAVRHLLAWRPIMIDETVLDAAFVIQDLHSISFWDALIVAAAQASGCSHLLTEDLQDGQDLSGVVVVNPFRHPPDSI